MKSFISGKISEDLEEAVDFMASLFPKIKLAPNAKPITKLTAYCIESESHLILEPSKDYFKISYTDPTEEEETPVEVKKDTGLPF